MAKKPTKPKKSLRSRPKPKKKDARPKGPAPEAVDVEVVPEQEAAWRDEIAAITVELQKKRKLLPLQDGEVLRGVHPKSHGCMDADFIVNKDIDSEYRVGLFARPGKHYKAKIRYSNAQVLILDDLEKQKDGSKVNGSRGMAIKVLGVKGPILFKDGRAKNQDFLMINTPEFAFGNVRDYRRLSRVLMTDPEGSNPKPYFVPAELLLLGIMDMSGKLKPPANTDSAKVTFLRQILKKYAFAFEEFSRADMLGTINSGKAVNNIRSKTVRNPLQVQYFSAAPFRYGPDRVMKFSVAPQGVEVPQPKFSREDADALDADYLAQALKNTVKQGEKIHLSFRVQVVEASKLAGRKKEEMIENASIAWAEEEYPFVEVARIVIHPVGENEQLVDACKSLLFTPWHALAAHEPLGGINRLRKPVYDKSAECRRNSAGNAD